MSLFRYLPRSGRALLNGTLPLRYCAARFACSTPTWRLPASGQVSRLVAAYPESAGNCSGEVFALGVPLVSKSSPVRKRFRLNRKTPCTPCRDIGSFSSTCLEETASGGGFHIFLCLITLGGDVIMQFGTLYMSMTEWELDDFPGIVQAHVSRFACLSN